MIKFPTTDGDTPGSQDALQDDQSSSSTGPESSPASSSGHGEPQDEPTPEELLPNAPPKLMDRYKRLKALGEERFAVLENQLRSGVSPTALARVIQQDWGEMVDVQTKTLTQQLNRYRWEMLASPEIVAQTDAELRLPKSLDYKQKLHVLSEMETLAMLQKERLNIALEQEKKVNMLMKQTTGEVTTLMSLLKDIQKNRIDLGLDRYDGPVLQGTRASQTRTFMPDGTVVEEQVVEAVQTALGVINQQYPGIADEGPDPDVLDADFIDHDA